MVLLLVVRSILEAVVVDIVTSSLDTKVFDHCAASAYSCVHAPASHSSHSRSSRNRAKSATVIMTRSCFLAEPNKVRYARHGSVVVDYLADHASRVQACKTRQIDCGLGLTPAFEDTTLASAKRKNVARPREIAGHTIWIKGGPDGLRPIVSRDARRNTRSHRN